MLKLGCTTELPGELKKKKSPYPWEGGGSPHSITRTSKHSQGILLCSQGRDCAWRRVCSFSSAAQGAVLKSLLETRNEALERRLRNSEGLGAPVESVRDELTVIKLS